MIKSYVLGVFKEQYVHARERNWHVCVRVGICVIYVMRACAHTIKYDYVGIN